MNDLVRIPALDTSPAVVIRVVITAYLYDPPVLLLHNRKRPAGSKILEVGKNRCQTSILKGSDNLDNTPGMPCSRDWQANESNTPPPSEPQKLSRGLDFWLFAVDT